MFSAAPWAWSERPLEHRVLLSTVARAGGVRNDNCNNKNNNNHNKNNSNNNNNNKNNSHAGSDRL